MNIVHEYHQMDAQTDSTFRSEKTPASDALMIRPMRREDIPLVAGIERQIYSLPWSGRAFSEALQRDYYLFLTAWHAGVLAGYCGFQRSFEIADITNVTVTDRYRRRGIGGGPRDGACPHGQDGKRGQAPAGVSPGFPG